MQSFALALREELSGSGVSVTALLPGPTDTEFFDRADLTDTRLGASDSKDDPAQVARQGYEGLMDGEASVFGGSVASRAMGRLSALTPGRKSVRRACALHTTGVQSTSVGRTSSVGPSGQRAAGRAAASTTPATTSSGVRPSDRT